MSEQVIPEHWARMIGGSALVGLITGAVILAIKTVVLGSEKELLEADPWLIAVALMIGAVASVPPTAPRPFVGKQHKRMAAQCSRSSITR